MAKNAHSTPTSPRRPLGAAVLAAVVAGFVPPAASAVVKVGRAIDPANPDADLIEVCAHHLTSHHNVNTHGGYLDPEDCPLWQAYSTALDAVCEARPTTAEGWLAKARCAQAERDEAPGNTAEELVWSLLEDIQSGRVRLGGRASA